MSKWCILWCCNQLSSLQYGYIMKIKERLWLGDIRVCARKVYWPLALWHEEAYETLSRLRWPCPYNVFSLQQVTNYLQLQSLPHQLWKFMWLFDSLSWYINYFGVFFCMGMIMGSTSNMNRSHMFLALVFVMSPMTLVGTFIPYSLNVSNMA